MPVWLGVCALALGAGCSSIRPCADDWLGRDKAYHFAAGCALGAGAAAAGHSAGWSEDQSGAASLGVALAIGGGKEWHDQEAKGTCWSWKDLAWDMAGAMAGWLVVAGANP